MKFYAARTQVVGESAQEQALEFDTESDRQTAIERSIGRIEPVAAISEFFDFSAMFSSGFHNPIDATAHGVKCRMLVTLDR